MPRVDHLFLNEAELTLPQFLADLQRDRPRAVYRTTAVPELKRSPLPLWELLNMKHYVSMNLQYSRGCPFNCEFCDITRIYGHKPRTKQTAQLLSEFDRLYHLGWRGPVFLVDDNFIGNKARLKSGLLPALAEWMRAKHYPFTLSTEASVNLADDEKLMEQMLEAGFEAVFLGIESPSQQSLSECNKHQNINRDLMASIKKIQRCGLRVRGGFIVGFDHDTPAIFNRQIEFIQQSGIITAMVGLLNAPRGTRLYRRIVSEGRLLKETTGDNTDFTTNFVPQMGIEALSRGYATILKGIYAPKPYYQRVKQCLKSYKPAPARSFRFHWGYLRNHFGYSGALVKSVVILGIRDRARKYYWKLILWSLFTRPRRLPQAVTYAIYGFHFRKVFEGYV